MFAARSFVAPVARAPIRPQAAWIPVHIRVSTLRARIAAMSTVSDVIIHDHKELKDCYDEIVNSTDHDHQARYGNQFVWELARHSIAEELIIYPAFEKYLGQEGKSMAESDRKEHHKLKEYLKEFQNMKASHPDYVPKLKSLYALLEQHIAEEERDDLPKFEKVLNNEDGVSAKLAVNFQRTKAFIPTRSHPSAGENPAFESVLGLLAAPIDKLADLFRKFPQK
ncbi:HHE domain-containing protein [Paraphaeosphaeria sporulosa]